MAQEGKHISGGNSPRDPGQMDGHKNCTKKTDYALQTILVLRDLSNLQLLSLANVWDIRRFCGPKLWPIIMWKAHFLHCKSNFRILFATKDMLKKSLEIANIRKWACGCSHGEIETKNLVFRYQEYNWFNCVIVGNNVPQNKTRQFQEKERGWGNGPPKLYSPFFAHFWQNAKLFCYVDSSGKLFCLLLHGRRKKHSPKTHGRKFSGRNEEAWHCGLACIYAWSSHIGARAKKKAHTFSSRTWKVKQNCKKKKWWNSLHENTRRNGHALPIF